MTVDEGGVPKCTLADCVSKVYAERAQKDGTAVRSSEIAADTAILLQQVASIEEFLARFRVREQLAEAQSILNSTKPKVEGGVRTAKFGHHTGWEAIRRSYNIDELGFAYHTFIVDPASASDYVKGTKSREGLRVDQNDLSTIVPFLGRYGVGLACHTDHSVDVIIKKEFWVPGREVSSYGTRIPGGPGEVGITGFSYYIPSDYVERYGEDRRGVKVIKSIMVEVGGIGLGPQEYYLDYSHGIFRDDQRYPTSSIGNYKSPNERLRNKKMAIDLKDTNVFPRPLQNHFMFLTPHIRINQDDPEETFQKLIGNDVVRELDGEFEDLYNKFATYGQKLTLRKDGYIDFKASHYEERIEDPRYAEGE